VPVGEFVSGLEFTVSGIFALSDLEGVWSGTENGFGSPLVRPSRELSVGSDVKAAQIIGAITPTVIPTTNISRGNMSSSQSKRPHSWRISSLKSVEISTTKIAMTLMAP
jgi:hypothetical protein